MANKPTSTSRHNECPICTDVSGKCRFIDSSDGEFILCWSNSGARLLEIINGHRCVKEAKAENWATFVVVGEANLEDLARKRQERELAKAREREELAKGALPIEDRDRAIRSLHRHFGLSVRHREDLRNRGLSDSQIDNRLYFTINPNQEVPFGISPNLPGVRDGRIKAAGPGYACVSFAPGHKASGWQIRLDDATDNKYRWAKGERSIHLKDGELPITSAYPNEIKHSAIWAGEGISKPGIAANRLGIVVLGAASANFAASPEQVEEHLAAASEYLGDTKEIVFTPDGGAVSNPHILKAYKRSWELFSKLGYQIKIAWWGQLTKNHPDIDELDSLEAIELITTKAFWDIVNHTKQQASRDEKLRQERLKLEASEAIYQNLTTLQDQPWREVNQPLIDLEGLGLEPGAIYIVVSAKGTGKTEGLIPIVGEYDRVLAWFNRIALGREECNRIGLTWKDNLSVDKGKKRGFCSDSAPQFAPHILGADGMLLADECDQVFEHNFGDTCNKDGKRPLILATLQAHIDAAIAGGGIALFMSADVAQKEIDYIKALAPEGCPVRLIVNHYKPAKGDLYFDLSPTPDARIERLLADLEEDIPCFVIDDIKNGVRGCKSIAEYIRTIHPEWTSQIVEINSDTSGSPEIIEFLENINEVSKTVRLICCSPSVVSGISIKNGRFINGVYGFFNGVLTINQICQALGRVRGAIVTNVWAAEQGLIYAANRATDPKEIKSWYHRNYEANCKHILGFGVEYNPIIGEWNSPHFELYCQNSAYRNLCMEKLRERLYKRLEQEGYMIKCIAPSDSDMVENGLKQSWSGIELAYALAVDNAKILSDEELKIFQKASKQPTPEEKLNLEKTFLLKSFGQELIDATVFEHKESGQILTGFAAMALKNQRGVYRNQLEAFYLLQSDLSEAITKDLAEERKQEAHGEGRFCGDLRWRTRQRKAREFLGLDQFLDPLKQWEPRHYAELVQKAKKNSGLVKDVLNLSVEKISGGQIFGEFMQQIGLLLQKEWAQTQPGQKRFKLRQIDPESWRYAQMYVAYRQSLKSESQEEMSAAQVEESPTVTQPAQAETLITPPYISIESQRGGDQSSAAETRSFDTISADCASFEVSQGSFSEDSRNEANCHTQKTVLELAEALPFCESIEQFALVAEDYPSDVVESAIALADTQPRRQELRRWYEAGVDLTEDASFCLKSLSKLESEGVSCEKELIALFEEMERRGPRCELLLPGDFWQRASSVIGFAADALEQKECRLEAASRLLKAAIGHGADTIRTVLGRWAAIERWEAVLKLEEQSCEDIQRLMQVAPNWAQWCEALL